MTVERIAQVILVASMLGVIGLIVKIVILMVEQS